MFSGRIAFIAWRRKDWTFEGSRKKIRSNTRISNAGGIFNGCWIRFSRRTRGYDNTAHVRFVSSNHECYFRLCCRCDVKARCNRSSVGNVGIAICWRHLYFHSSEKTEVVSHSTSCSIYADDISADVNYPNEGNVCTCDEVFRSHNVSEFLHLVIIRGSYFTGECNRKRRFCRAQNSWKHFHSLRIMRRSTSTGWTNNVT
mmetsp:Transcript_5277/g.16773  ORF Transcript_5277/g.16773 Transcript_5277/m.16773 type:complete len:200 (-) Transcript_5277:1626-2225(-)